MSTKKRKPEGISKITVAILEDNSPLLKGMQMELDKPDIEICSASEQPDTFLSEVEKCQPAIAIIDLRIWSDFEAGFNAIRRIRDISPRTQCIIYTFYEKLEYFHHGVNLGIKAYVSKNINEISLDKVVRIVANGGTYYGKLLDQYLDKVKEMPDLTNFDEPPTTAQNHLSERELEILRLLGQGRTEDEIAAGLVVSINTIKAHTKNIRGKLGVKTTLDAVRLGRLRGLI